MVGATSAVSTSWRSDLASLENVAELRKPLINSLKESIGRLGFSQGRLLLHEVGQLDEQAFGRAALTCQALAEELGSPRRQALAAATMLALFEVMAAVVEEVASANEGKPGRPQSLSAEWGTALTLNAADAFFALAQEAAFDLCDSLAEEAAAPVLLGRIDACCAAWCQETAARFAGEPLSGGSDALFDAAVELAGLLAGVGEGDRIWLRSLFGLEASEQAEGAEITLQNGPRARVELLAAGLAGWRTDETDD